MSKMKTRPFDMANYLHDEAEVAEYLRQVLEDGDPCELAAALGDIARARHDPCLPAIWASPARVSTKASQASAHSAQRPCSKSSAPWASSCRCNPLRTPEAQFPGPQFPAL